MAMDFLSVPGEFLCSGHVQVLILLSATSVDIEQAFSQGRDLLSYCQNHMSPLTTHSLILLGSWIRTGVVTCEQMLAWLP